VLAGSDEVVAITAAESELPLRELLAG
jgi:hypothetical protein